MKGRGKTPKRVYHPHYNGSGFYALSSFNRRGGRMHPVVARRLNQVLDLWAIFATQEEIAKALDISADTVKDYIRRARRRGDPRAIRPKGVDGRAFRASIKRKRIKALADAGFGADEIARSLGCNVRLVQIRLKEEACKMARIVPIGGRGNVTIYMHEGFAKPHLTIGEYVQIAIAMNVDERLTLIAGTPSNPRYSWPVYARVNA